MKLSIMARKNSEIFCRIFDPLESKWYTGASWVTSEVNAQKINLSKILMTNEYEDRYVGDINIPSGGKYIVEYVDKSTGVTIAEEETEDPVFKQMLNDSSLARKLQSNKAVISDDGSLVTIYDDDQATPIMRFVVSQDQKTRIPQA